MRTYTYLSFCIFFACLPLHAQQPVVGDDGRSDVESKIISLEKRLWNGDVDDVSKLEAEDYEVIKHAHRYHRADDEAAAKEANFALVSMDDIRVRMLRPDVALLTYHATEKGSFRGTDVPPSLYFASIWVDRAGEWKNVFLEENLPDAFTDTYMPVASSVFGSKQTKATEIQPPEPDSFFIKKEKEVWEALKHKDKAAATRLLADDFVGMYDFGFFNKSEWVKQIDDQYTVDDYTIMNPKVLHPSPTTALLLYTSTCKGTGAWADYCSNTSRISDLWVERNGEWLALFSQDTTATENDQDNATVLKEIISSENQIVGALSRDDIAGFGKLLPEDVLDIWTDGVHKKAEWIPQFEQQKKEGYLFRDFRFDDPKLIRLAPNAAILIATEIIHGLDKGKPFEQRLYTMACYVHRNGKWVPRVYQDTPVESEESDEAVMKAIVANEQKILEVLKRNDITAFGNMLPEDVIMVEDDGIHTKPVWLKEFEEQKKTGLLFTDFKMEDLRLVRYGASAATLVFKETVDGLQKGKPFEWHINSSSGYVKRGDRWVPVLYQDVMAK